MRRGLVGTLTGRLALLVVGVVVFTAVVAGLLAVELTRQAAESSARQQLARLADTTETRADRTEQPGALARTRRLLKILGVDLAVVNPRGRLNASSPLARTALTADEVDAVVGGKALSDTRTVSDVPVYVEARPTDRGAVVLVQPRSDALAPGERAIRRTLLALLVGVAFAVPAAVLVARSQARPLRRVVDATQALAAGRRDVDVPVEGPEEVADVAVAVNTLARSLERSEAQQRAFLLSVSHDLRTPLTTLKGYAESLADGVLEPERLPDVGRVMVGESARLEHLVEDLLDLARLQADRFRVELGPTDVRVLVEGTAAAWAGRCRIAGVELRLEDQLPAGLAPVETDAARVRQALDGLLENALRVTPAGAPLVLAARVEGSDRVALEVRDGGPGLTSEDLEDAFRPGVLYDRYRGVRPSGSGLGLAIVHGLVERLGGTVEAGHAPEAGARFTVRLPLA